MNEKTTVFWFRRDLRLFDNCGLYHALRSGYPVLPVFIFDPLILDHLEDKKDARLEFIHQSLKAIKDQLERLGSSLLVIHGEPVNVWNELPLRYNITAVYSNEDYEPYAIQRDNNVRDILHSRNIPLLLFKDQVIFSKNDILNLSGNPYTVYTPYSRKWIEKYRQSPPEQFSVEEFKNNFYKTTPLPFPGLQEIGFHPTGIIFPEKEAPENIIRSYKETRDYPAKKGTSLLGIHLRFGTISVRQLAAEAASLNETFLKELIWREFFMMVLYHFPFVVDRCFRNEFENIQWRNDEDEFLLWQQGNTGYPMVDAGMRELNATGYMHNRVRMVAASFLCKHLLIDWRWGEAYFAQKLLDYELSSNNGNWQWAAGTGTDAAPYFRIFNPAEQIRKFDPELIYIKKWVPEFNSLSYPKPVVDHAFARKRALEVYGNAKKH